MVHVLIDNLLIKDEDKATSDFDCSNNLIERFNRVMMFRSSSKCLTVKDMK